jgi:hypothetical protein
LENFINRTGKNNNPSKKEKYGEEYITVAGVDHING